MICRDLDETTVIAPEANLPWGDAVGIEKVVSASRYKVMQRLRLAHQAS